MGSASKVSQVDKLVRGEMEKSLKKAVKQFRKKTIWLFSRNLPESFHDEVRKCESLYEATTKARELADEKGKTKETQGEGSGSSSKPSGSNPTASSSSSGSDTKKKKQCTSCGRFVMSVLTTPSWNTGKAEKRKKNLGLE